MIDSAEYLNQQFYLSRIDTLGGKDLSVTQAKVLVILQRTGPIPMRQLSIGLGRAFSTTTSTVDRLVEKELMVRHPNPSDRRGVICEITQEGITALQETWRIGGERLGRLCDIMSDDDLVAAVRGLEAIRNAEMQIQKVIADLAPDPIPHPH